MYRDLAISGIAGLTAGAAHYWAHTTYGAASAFGTAGVTAAGVTVVLVSAAGTYLVRWLP